MADNGRQQNSPYGAYIRANGKRGFDWRYPALALGAPLAGAAGSAVFGAGGASIPAAASSGVSAAPVAAAGAGMTGQTGLQLASLLGNIFTNLWGTSKATSANNKATQATIDAQLEAAKLQKQAADDQLAYLKQTDQRDYRDYQNAQLRDRTDWEASERRKAPFRALADSAVRTLADYIHVPGMAAAQEVPVPHWSPYENAGPSAAGAPVNHAMRDSSTVPAYTGGDPRAYVNALLPHGASSPQELAALEPQLKAAGVTLQRSSAGDVRGRVYLPSTNGDPYSNYMDVFNPNFGGGGGGAQQAAPTVSRTPDVGLYRKYSRRPSSLASLIA